MSLNVGIYVRVVLCNVMGAVSLFFFLLRIIFSVSKKNPDMTLERHLIKLWLRNMYQSLAPMKSRFRVVSQQLIDSSKWHFGGAKTSFPGRGNRLVWLGGEIGGSDTRRWNLMKSIGQGDIFFSKIGISVLCSSTASSGSRRQWTKVSFRERKREEMREEIRQRGEETSWAPGHLTTKTWDFSPSVFSSEPGTSRTRIFLNCPSSTGTLCSHINYPSTPP